MKHTVKETEKCQVTLTVVVDGKEWKDAQDKAFRKQAAKVSIPGFRPGKAPEAMLREHVNQRQVLDDALNEAIGAAYGYGLREAKLRPFGQPGVEVTKVTLEEAEFVFHVTLLPEVKLGTYKGLKAEKKVASVSEEELSAHINRLLENNADLVVVDREAKMGDTLVIDFEGFLNGEPFEGGKAENYSLELGSHSFIPGFEEALVGAKKDEDRDVNVTFPEQYVEELAGKPAVFKCKIHEVKEKKIPALTDETVKDLAIQGVETVEALKEHEKAHLLEHKEQEASREHYEALVKQIVAGATVTIAPSILAEETKTAEERIKHQVEENGLTFEQYLQMTGQTEEKLRETTRANTEENLKTYLVLEEISIEEKLLVSDEELEGEFTKMAEQYKMKVEEVKAAFGNNLEGFRENLRQKKVQDFILANNQ